MSSNDPLADRTGSSSDPGLRDALRGFVPEVSAPIIEEEILIEIDSDGRNRRDDDVLLARFFGVSVIMIGLITVLPAVYYWVISANQELPVGEAQWQVVSRWAYLIGFLGALHILFGVFTIQVVDYSALQSLSIFLLLVTCVYGFVGMSLILDEGNGTVATFLQLPEVIKSRATIWCGIMFGITALGCYLFGREALLWRRRVNSRVAVDQS